MWICSLSLLGYSLRYNGSHTENMHKTYQERIDNKNKKESPATARPYVTTDEQTLKDVMKATVTLTACMTATEKQLATSSRLTNEVSPRTQQAKVT